jgi:hypothetical protein
MKILALDLATRTGFAHSNGVSGTFDLSIRKDESSGMRLVRFEAKLLEIINSVGVDVIVFEAALAFGSRPAGMDPVRLQSKLQAIIERLVERSGKEVGSQGWNLPRMEHRSYTVQEIKKHAIPEKGRKRDKAAMVEAAKEKWPDVEIEDDNVADALFLLDLAKKELGV